MDGQGDLTAGDVHNVAFSKPPFGQRGYNEDEVDDFLDIVERRLADPVNVRRPSAYDVASVVFSKPPIGKRGYDEGEVDAFVAAVVRHLEKTDGTVVHRDAPPAPSSETPPPPAPTYDAPPAQAYEAPPLDSPRAKKWWQLW